MQKFKKFIALMAIVSLVAVNGFVQNATAASIIDAKDVLSDSDTGSVSTHTLTFTNTVALANGEYFDVTLPSVFSVFAVGNITCPASTTASYPGTRVARCTATSPVASGTPKVITITNVTNPGTPQSASVLIEGKNSGGTTVYESVTVVVAVIDNVLVSASVPSTLTFSIVPLATTTSVNGTNTTIGAATTTLNFGTLTVATPAIMGQELRVITNANDGFSVTVEQDRNLTSNAGSDIDSFLNGTSTMAGWSGPSGLLDQEWTYGHFGLTSDDDTLGAGYTDTFGANQWTGLVTSTPIEVLRHSGPADGSTQNKGMAKVGYQIQISALQEAGDYTNVLTYIATPTY